MNTVKVSPKYQVVIPKDIRESMRIVPGQRVRVFQYGDRIEMVPVRKPRELRGFASGIDTSVPRDKARV